MRSAILRSKCEPLFGRSEGDKFMVIFCAGKAKSSAKSAAFTRSVLSLMLVLARPTILKPGSPREKIDSTSMIFSPSP